MFCFWFGQRHSLGNLWTSRAPITAEISMGIAKCHSCNMMVAFLTKLISLTVMILQSGSYVRKSRKKGACNFEKLCKIVEEEYQEKPPSCCNAYIQQCSCHFLSPKDKVTFRYFLNCEVTNLHVSVGFHGNGNTHLIGHLIFVIRMHNRSNIWAKVSPVALSLGFGKIWDA